MLRSVALPRDRIVLIFARAPRDERRAKPLADGAPAAAVEALHDRLLQRTMAVARASGVATRLVTTAETRSCGGAAELDVVLQQGATFAERLENAVADAFAAGFGDVVVVGADTPALEPKHLRRAFGELAAARGPCAVVGPACDGGYYLLALNAFCAAAFRRVPLGTARAFGATVDALEHAGFAVATLPPLRDVDDCGDVRWLCRCGGALGRAARAVRAPRVPATTRSSAATPPPFFAAIPARGPPVLPSIDL